MRPRVWGIEYGAKVGRWNSDIFEAQWMEILSAKNSGCPHGVWGKGGREGFWILLSTDITVYTRDYEGLLMYIYYFQYDCLLML